MIIHTKRPLIRKLIELIATLLGWGFLALFLWNLSQHFNWRISMKFYVLSLENSNSIILATLVFLIFSGMMLGAWSNYNKRKYGHLKRRKFPQPTNSNDLSTAFKTSEEEVKLLQQKGYVEIQ